MSIPESVVEAASILQPTAEVRARAVILAMAENLPERVVGKALSAFYANGVKTFSTREALRASIVAALREVGGE